MMPDHTLPPEGDNPFAASPFAPDRLPYASHPVQPRLGIAHLLVLTAAVAAALAVERARLGLPLSPGAFRVWQSVVWAMVYGPALASVPLWAHRRWSGGPAFPVQPGHWLLVVTGGLWIVSNATWFLVHLLAGIALRWGLYSCVVYGLSAAAWACALRWLRDAAHWRVFFSAAATICGLAAALSIPATLSMSTGVLGFGQLPRAFRLLVDGILLVSLLAAVVKDWQLSIRRDWLHWTGVCVACGVFLRTFAYVVFATWW